MLKKFAVLAAFMFAAIPLAPSALAWEEVCVKFPLWKTAFVGRIVVVTAIDLSRPPLPHNFRDPLRPRVLLEVPDGLRGDHPKPGAWPARDTYGSGNFLANQSNCVDITKIPEGQDFVVFVVTTYGNAMAHCPPNRVHHPKVGYAQQRANYKQIWWEAWGAAGSPRCKFVGERN